MGHRANTQISAIVVCELGHNMPSLRDSTRHTIVPAVPGFLIPCLRHYTPPILATPAPNVLFSNTLQTKKKN